MIALSALLAACGTGQPEGGQNGTAAASFDSVAHPADTTVVADSAAPAPAGGDTAAVPGETTYTVDRVIVPGPAGPPGRPARLLPVDEAAQAPDFLAYRQRLIDAVAANDTDALTSMMADDIRLSFGGSRGVDDFREMWNPSDEDARVWKILSRVLAGGGLYERGPFDLEEGTAAERFTAPYWFAAFPGERYDAFTHGVITDENVPVRSAPRSDAPIIDTLSYAVVKMPQHAAPEDEWAGIELPDGRSGYVRSDVIASPIGYRALFHRMDGEWKMTAFVAGD